MSAPVKTIGTSLLAIQTLADKTFLASAAIDVSAKFAARVSVYFGRTVVTALTNPVNFRIEVSDVASPTSGTESLWVPYFSWNSDITVALSVTATSGSAGSTNLGGNFSSYVINPQDILFAYQSGTIANSEWQYLNKTTSTTSCDAVEKWANGHNGDAILNKGQFWTIPVDLTGWGRLRLVADSSQGPAQTTVVQAYYSTLDSVS